MLEIVRRACGHDEICQIFSRWGKEEESRSWYKKTHCTKCFIPSGKTNAWEGVMHSCGHVVKHQTFRKEERRKKLQQLPCKLCALLEKENAGRELIGNFQLPILQGKITLIEWAEKIRLRTLVKLMERGYDSQEALDLVRLEDQAVIWVRFRDVIIAHLEEVKFGE